MNASKKCPALQNDSDDFADYLKINKAIQLYFFQSQRIQENYLLFSFDEYDLSEVSKKIALSKDFVLSILIKYFKREWRRLLTNENYFGLIALQCYVASLMIKDELFTANAYLPKLNQLLGFRNNNQAMGIFHQQIEGFNGQDLLWALAKRYIKFQKLASNIPEIKEGPGRNVQYPLSQSLLNRQDLLSFASYFLEKNLRPDEELSLVEFEKIIEFSKICNNNKITRHARKIIKEYDSTKTLEIILLQIFNFYQTWDGTISSIQTSDKQYIEKAPFSLLLVEEEAASFYFYLNKNHDQPYQLNKQFFKKLKQLQHKTFQKKLVLFRNISPYPDDYEEVRLAGIGERIVLIFDVDTYPFLVSDLCDKEDKIRMGAIQIIKFTITENDAKLPYFRRFIQNYKLRLREGLRVGWTNTWLENAGPIVEIQGDKKTAYVNGKIVEFKCSTINFNTAPSGRYVIKVEQHTLIDFEIVKGSFDVKIPITDKDVSWNIETWQPAEEGILHGQHLSNEILSKESTVRKWIKTLNNQPAKNSNNIVVKTLKRSNPWHIKRQ